MLVLENNEVTNVMDLTCQSNVITTGEFGNDIADLNLFKQSDKYALGKVNQYCFFFVLNARICKLSQPFLKYLIRLL